MCRAWSGDDDMLMGGWPPGHVKRVFALKGAEEACRTGV